MALNQVARPRALALLIAALASPLPAAAPGPGPAPLQGFWHRESLRCAPDTAPACRALHGAALDADLAIAIRGDTIVTTRPNRRATFDPTVLADTVVIGGTNAHWIAGHRGYTSTAVAKPKASLDKALDTTRHVYYGRASPAPAFAPVDEKWSVSADGRVLMYEHRFVDRGLAVRVIETYHRAA